MMLAHTAEQGAIAISSNDMCHLTYPSLRMDVRSLPVIDDAACNKHAITKYGDRIAEKSMFCVCLKLAQVYIQESCTIDRHIQSSSWISNLCFSV